MLSSGYAILYQKDKRYLYRATFYIKKSVSRSQRWLSYLFTRLLMLSEIHSLNSGLLHRRPQTKRGWLLLLTAPLSSWSLDDSPPPPNGSPVQLLGCPLLRDAGKIEGQKPSLLGHVTLIGNHPRPASAAGYPITVAHTILCPAIPIPSR